MTGINFNELTPAEIERLSVLTEECADVMCAVGKILRFGYRSISPGEDIDNRALLETELGHVQFAIWLMLINDDVNSESICESQDAKPRQIQHELFHNGKVAP